MNRKQDMHALKKKKLEDYEYYLCDNWEDSNTSDNAMVSDLRVMEHVDIEPADAEYMNNELAGIDDDDSKESNQPATNSFKLAIDSGNYFTDVKRKSRTFNFNRAKKIEIINAIKKNPCIWDSTMKTHYDAALLRKAWHNVSLMVGKDVDVCKTAWYSLRDSLRYFARKSKASGKNESIDWDMAEHMSFLLTLKDKLKTHSENKKNNLDTLKQTKKNDTKGDAKVESDNSTFLADDQQNSAISCTQKSDLESNISGAASGSKDKFRAALQDSDDSDSLMSCSYQHVSKKTRSNSRAADDNIMETINSLMKQSQNLISTPKLKHYDMYLFWDHIMADLPSNVLNDVRFKVTALLQEIVKQHADSEKSKSGLR